MARPLPIALAVALAAVATGQDNVLVVMLDDVGVDRVRAYGEHPSPAPTPTLDALANEGVLFRNCWATPFCSPTRATVMTGRHGFRTGIGNIVTTQVDETGLSLDEWILPEVLTAGTEGAYRTAAIGKWHLAGPADSPWNAMQAGFELYSGAPQNLGSPGDEAVWWNFAKLIPGGSEIVTQYATTDEVDDALRTIEGFGNDPWFLYLALHAAHQPYHAPPGHLQDRPLAGDPEDSKPLHHKAAVQAIDSELGRLLGSLPAAVRARTCSSSATTARRATRSSRRSSPPTARGPCSRVASACR